MPFDFGIGEIAIVLVIGLLVFGPKKLPEISRGLGSGMRDLRKGLSGEFDETPAATPVVETAAPAAEQAAPVAAAVAAEPAPAAEPVAAEPVAAKPAE